LETFNNGIVDRFKFENVFFLDVILNLKLPDIGKFDISKSHPTFFPEAKIVFTG